MLKIVLYKIYPLIPAFSPEGRRSFLLSSIGGED